MRFRIQEPEIIRENPFLNDKLDREQCASVLSRIFSRTEGPLTMSLNSPWGTGKTTFIKMFREHLLNIGFPVIYLNVWKTDFHDNPLIAFIGELISEIDDLKRHGYDTERARKILKKIKRTGKEILKKSVPVAVKTAQHNTPDFEKGVDDAISDFTSGILENQIKNYTSGREQIRKFKDHLRELVEELQKNENSRELEKHPLIFFVDELDRCRPEYSIQILEKIKHLFNIEGIIFVISADMEQLGHSVKTIFGQNMREKSYFRKFIDLEFNLPNDNYTAGLYCRYVARETEIEKIIRGNSDYESLLIEIENTSVLMSYTFSFSLSDINFLFNSVNLILAGNEKIDHNSIVLLLILISVRMRNTKLFNQIINRERTVYYVINEINKVKKMPKSVKEYDRFLLERRLSLLNLKQISDDDFQKQLVPSSVPNSNELNNIYKTIKDNSISQSTEMFTEMLFRKIRLLDSFDSGYK